MAISHMVSRWARCRAYFCEHATCRSSYEVRCIWHTQNRCGLASVWSRILDAGLNGSRNCKRLVWSRISNGTTGLEIRYRIFQCESHGIRSNGLCHLKCYRYRRGRFADVFPRYHDSPLFCSCGFHIRPNSR